MTKQIIAFFWSNLTKKGHFREIIRTSLHARVLLCAGLAFGFLEDPLCKVFALSKLLRKTPCSGLEPGKPLFQRFSWLRFFCIVKFTLFFRGVCPQNRKAAPQATFLAPQAKLFGPERLGSQENPFFGPKKPLVQHFGPPRENPLCSILTPCSA